ncbi:MAG: NUDIX hydrolase [Desulfatitalea sp. BRH_c12]|nr:MAG: NUDIX hydrolase [Desulfatitalea sp. BRH_c12]
MTFDAKQSSTLNNKLPALFFIFDQGRLLVRNADGECHIPEAADIEKCGLRLARKQYLGALDGQACYAAELDTGAAPGAPFAFKELRSLFDRLDETLIWVAGRANHLLYWQRTHRYCGACGHPTEEQTKERALFCPQCGLVNYPRLSPAVIVAVIDGPRILLARNVRAKTPFYSVLAGFVEPGETLEQCIAREVKEEVGVSVRNIRYFGSQPWPFPNSLMIAFTADYAGGTITPDMTEIIEADWYTKDDLPRVPPTISIAGQLIEWFRLL